MTAPPPPSVRARRGPPLSGTTLVPGDKSISHRAIMLGGIATGPTSIKGLLESEDIAATMAALKAVGASVRHDPQTQNWTVEGPGLENLQESDSVLNMGNSGTSARLLIGLLGARPMTSFFAGDASLQKRPMGRVIEPLTQMGLTFMARHQGRLPLAVCGKGPLRPINYRLPVASAQVKSAILLAALSIEGTSTVIEPIPTRDPTERMLRAFGADIHVEKTAAGTHAIHLQGRPKLTGQKINVPGDISAAAFPLVAALLSEGSAITLQNVGINERRAGLITSLLEMGGNIALENKRTHGGEEVADLHVKGSKLHGITIEKERAPSMIDEYPILAMAAACAKGTSRFKGLEELRVKESDRLTLVAAGLRQAGVDVAIEGDDLIIHGNGMPPKGGALINAALDHRIAMSFLILGMLTDQPITIDDASPIATSFPNFIPLMTKLGGNIA
ncbi:MAG: 3-phosphoshikimate 1-carboxyvinyltransferase [Alphaproteobacteria bacterium]|nr:3-phosphoshikimate 1-carboxyvinyltransferase [Alphaproteobacteria bacterium]